jgi:hypothetical protein
VLPKPWSRARKPATDLSEVLNAICCIARRVGGWRIGRLLMVNLNAADVSKSLGARKELAQELGYGGALDGSAEMNMWLHRAVMQKLAENGGRVPDSLRD